MRATALLTALAMVAFAANSLLTRGAVDAGHIDAISFTTIRLVSGALALAVLAGAGARSWRSGSWPSALALYAYAISFSLAYTQIPAGIGALLLFGAVQMTMIGYVLVRGTRLRRGEWAGLGLALSGLFVLTRPGLSAPDPVGVALMMAAGCAWGLYTLRGRNEPDPLEVTAGNFARALVPTMVTAALVGPFLGAHSSPLGIGLALGSGVVASAGGYAVWYAALRGLTATNAAIVQLSAPLLAAVGGVVLLGEPVTFRLGLASPLLLGGILVAVLARERHRPHAAAGGAGRKLPRRHHGRRRAMRIHVSDCSDQGSPR